ncbi:hypothetical protein C8Q76DRAFT_852501 [Earliella scabrosa]|nr:hypothetical protein C8Q76DRAFT_852501 [Earliella scabrosa]
MGQLFYLINIDRKEISREIWGKIGESLTDDCPDVIWSLCKTRLPPVIDGWRSRARALRQPGSLFKLSTELLRMIFDATDTLTTKTAFALTCTHLLSVGEDSIARAMQETHCPWADCRLILLGEYTDLDKLPPGMLTPEEVQEIKTAPIESDWPDDRDLPVLPSEFVEQFYSKKPDWYTHLTKETYAVDERLEREYYRQYRDWADNDDNPPRTSDQIRFDKFLCRRSATRGPVVEPHIGPTVLANLSKDEYIVEDSLFRYADIDHAMLVKICWSSSNDHSIGSDALFEMVRYGSWAGDRIRFTSVGRLPNPGTGRQWKDITAEVNVILEAIWRDRRPQLFQNEEDDQDGEDEGIKDSDADDLGTDRSASESDFVEGGFDEFDASDDSGTECLHD